MTIFKLWFISLFTLACDALKCERLKTFLTYSQENAPKDLSDVLPIIVEKVNRELEGVVDVEVLFTGGDMHQRVGEHTVKCSVSRLLSAVTLEKHQQADFDEKGVDDYGRDVVTQCFHVVFSITDVDECTLPVGHPMRHQCRTPAVCVNTIGSYECLCPSSTIQDTPPKVASASFWELVSAQERSAWDLSFNSSSESSCPSSASTFGCCDQNGQSIEGSTCRSAFHCPSDPCSLIGGNDCDLHSVCKRAESPLDKPNYRCECLKGLMGNGHLCRPGIDPKPRPMVMFDGSTPTDETVRNGYYCGCMKPIVDPCSGFPKCEGKHEVCKVSDHNQPICACKTGFVKIEPLGCVDETPPTLKLRNDPNGDGITRLKQGDMYKEHAVDILDENAEDYLRSLKIAYSRPLPHGCLTDVGSFQVNYTVATPWTSPPYVRVSRKVMIEDVDECLIDVDKYEIQCPFLIPQCDFRAGATCSNTNGSYTCKCPKFTTGDGFKHISSLNKDKTGNFIGAPVGYHGGTGCRDTSKPVINIIGPNPKIFRTCPWMGLTGVMDITRKQKDSTRSAVTLQRDGYEVDIKKMIKVSIGAELCATYNNIKPNPSDCVKATDHTYLGDVDLTSRVTVGEPVQKSPIEWRVPYDVIDDAGNAGDTVWRDIVVEEVNLEEFETKIRREVLANQEEVIKYAVEEALDKERKTAQIIDKSRSKGRNGVNIPSSCPPCQCSKDTSMLLTVSECEHRCSKKLSSDGNTCFPSSNESQNELAITVHPILRDIIKYFEGTISSGFILFFFLFVIGAFVLIILDRLLTAISSTRGWYYMGIENEEQEREMLSSVKYHKSPEQIRRETTLIPPRSGAAVGSGLFSPPQNRVYGQQRNILFSSGDEAEDSIYKMNPITPTKSNGMMRHHR